MLKLVIITIVLLVLGIAGALVFSNSFLLTTGLHPTQIDTYQSAQEKANDIKNKLENQYAPNAPQGLENIK